MNPGEPSRWTKEPYGETMGTISAVSRIAAETAKNVNRLFLGVTILRCVTDTKRVPHLPVRKVFHRLNDENTRKTMSATGIIRQNLAITSIVFPLHMRFDDISDISAANSMR